MSVYKKVCGTDDPNDPGTSTGNSPHNPGLDIGECFQDELVATGHDCDLVGSCDRNDDSDGMDDEGDIHNPNISMPLHLQDQPRITCFDACMHLIKGNLGPGCLNLPHAFSQSGWLLGTVLFSIVALQGVYSMILLTECKQLLHNTSRPVFTFMDVAQVSLGSKGHAFVQVFLFVLQSGVCCVFLSLIATNLQAQTPLSENQCITLTTGSLLLVSLVRYMKGLRWLSTTANIFMLTAIITAVTTATSEIIHKDLPLPPKGTSDLGNIATFISSMFFSFEGIGLVLPIENTFTVSDTSGVMHDANQVYRTYVLPGSMSVVGILFWTIGFFASWGYPDIENGSITAYLSERFPNQAWFKVINTMVMMAVFLTFPLQLTPALEVLEGWLESNDTTLSIPNDEPNEPSSPCETPSNISGSHVEILSQQDMTESLCSANTCWKKYEWIILRYAIIFGCSIVVLVVDDLGTLMALFGAVGQTGLAMMPCLCHLALQRQGIAPKNRLKTLMDIMTIAFSTLVMGFGLVVSIGRMI